MLQLPAALLPITPITGTAAASRRFTYPDAVYGQYVILNIAAALMVQIGHRTLYYMVGISQWTFHFIHYFCPFVLLAFFTLTGHVKRRPITLRQIWPISFSQFLVSSATCVIHSDGKYGSLYTMRLSDFAITLLTMYLLPIFLGRKAQDGYRSIIAVIAISSSLAWLDFGAAETSWYVIAALPVFVGASAVHYLLTSVTQQKLGVRSHELMLYNFGLTSLFLFPMAFFKTTDSFNGDLGPLFAPVAYWGVIDFIVPLCGFFFHSVLVFSKYWLMGNLSMESFLVSRQFKYTLASFMQWFAVNIEYFSLFSFFAKLIAIGSAAVYLRDRRRDLKATAGGKAYQNGSTTMNGYAHMNGHHKNGHVISMG